MTSFGPLIGCVLNHVSVPGAETNPEFRPILPIISRLERVRFTMIKKTTAVIAISVAVQALAALGTVFLIFAAHAATIRRVNATLIEISGQLKTLKQTDAL
jgi:hypothetical protein